MRLVGISLNIVLFSLMATSAHYPDAGDPIANSRGLPTTNQPETNVCGTIGTLILGRLRRCPWPEAHTSPYYYSIQPAPPQSGRRTTRINTVAILLAPIVWFIWRYLGSGRRNMSRGLSTHQFGRAEAVLGLTPSQDDPPLHDSDSFKPQSHPGRSATVVSVDGTPCHTPPPVEVVDISLLGELPKVLEDLAETNLPETPTPLINAFQRFAATVLRIPPTWTKPSTRQPEQTMAHTPIRLREPAPLRRALYKGSRDLEESILYPDRFTFLAIGVDISEQKDAENDTKYLRQMFESSTDHSSALRFKHISGPSATYSNVRETVLSLLDEAQATPGPSQIFMLFTGTGNIHNEMCLANDEALSESDVNQWVLAKSIDQTNEYNIGVLFDICRTAMSRLTTTCQPVEVAWSCSIGQYAYAIRISDNKLIPRSTFLLAIFLAAHDLVHNSGGCFETAFKFHIKQLGELIRFMYHRDHQDQCSRNPAHQQCEVPETQTPDLPQGGHVVVNLGVLIATRFPQHACEVFAAVNHKMLQEGFHRLFCPLSASCAKRSNKPTVKDES